MRATLRFAGACLFALACTGGPGPLPDEAGGDPLPTQVEGSGPTSEEPPPSDEPVDDADGARSDDADG